MYAKVPGACKLARVEEEILSAIKPSKKEKERAEEAARRARSLVENALRDLGITEASVTIEGSYAKDTWISGDLDLDLFILLPPNECLDVIKSSIVDRLAAKLSSMGLTTEKRYAQHPYLRALVNDIWVEIVPGCAVPDPDKPVTAVDRTPFHRQYVISKMTPEMRDETRLLKSFMKGVGVYGAEIAIQGFSGYLVELLIIHYGCFRSVLEAAQSWRPPVVIDIENYYRDKRVLLKKFKDAAMIVVDPVDPDRNVAAVVSRQSLARFIVASLLYLNEPRKDFFYVPEAVEKPRPLPGKVLAVYGPRAGNTIIALFESPQKLPPDNLWGIAKRVLRAATRLLEHWGFRILDAGAYASEEGRRFIVLVELESRTLPQLQLNLGPPAWNTSNAYQFIKKYQADETAVGPWITSDGRLAVARPRRYRDAIALLRDRMGEWLPSSAQGFIVSVAALPEAIDRLQGDELAWLLETSYKAPHWMKPRR